MELTPNAVNREEEVGPARSARGADSESELDWQDPGGLLERYRQYLLIIANEVIGPGLRAKVGASDLVQDTFLQAQRSLDGFRGRTGAELRAWLRAIMERRLANVQRSYLNTEKRATIREVAMETLLTASGQKCGGIAARSPSPSDHAVRSELAAALRKALGRLPEHYRLAFVWRHQDQLSWDEIGRRIGCSADAARKTWSRAIHQLRTELGDYGSPP